MKPSAAAAAYRIRKHEGCAYREIGNRLDCTEAIAKSLVMKYCRDRGLEVPKHRRKSRYDAVSIGEDRVAEMLKRLGSTRAGL